MNPVVNDFGVISSSSSSYSAVFPRKREYANAIALNVAAAVTKAESPLATLTRASSNATSFARLFSAAYAFFAA